jgi:hypothetical protein
VILEVELDVRLVALLNHFQHLDCFGRDLFVDVSLVKLPKRGYIRNAGESKTAR